MTSRTVERFSGVRLDSGNTTGEMTEGERSRERERVRVHSYRTLTNLCEWQTPSFAGQTLSPCVRVWPARLADTILRNKFAVHSHTVIFVSFFDPLIHQLRQDTTQQTQIAVQKQMPLTRPTSRGQRSPPLHSGKELPAMKGILHTEHREKNTQF